MKYKVGDKVRVREDLKEGIYKNQHAVGSMLVFKGKIVEIASVNDGYYTIKESRAWHWSEDMFETKPRICEVLGVGVDEEFSIKHSVFNPFHVNKKGELICNSGTSSSDWAVEIINNPELIERMPKYTDKQKEIFKALKVLGFNWIARDKDDEVVAFDTRPNKLTACWHTTNCKSSEFTNKTQLNFDFIKWEDEEPFEIPNF